MSISTELEKLEELHRRGALSADEFTRAKARVLGGAAPGTNAPPALGAINAFRRSRSDRWFGGVCGGLAQITGLAAWAWRLIFTLLALCAGSGVVVYALLWLFVPEQSAGISSSETPAGQH